MELIYRKINSACSCVIHHICDDMHKCIHRSFVMPTQNWSLIDAPSTVNGQISLSLYTINFIFSCEPNKQWPSGRHWPQSAMHGCARADWGQHQPADLLFTCGQKIFCLILCISNIIYICSYDSGVSQIRNYEKHG